MCFGMQESKQVQTSSQTNPAVGNAATSNLTNTAGLTSNLPNTYGTQYGGDLTASLSPGQQGTIDAGTAIANNGTGDQAASLIGQYAGAGPQSVQAGTIADNMSPYMNQYVMQALAPQMQAMDIQDAKTRAATNATATGSGAFGDARTGIEQATNQSLSNANREGVIGNAYNAAFNTAIGAGAQDVSNNLAAQNANAGYAETALGRALGGSQALQGLQTQQLGTQTSANALNQQDTAQQQAAMTAAYNNWLQSQQSGLQALTGANQTVATGAQAFPASTTQTTSQPDNSGLALGGALLGAII